MQMKPYFDDDLKLHLNGSSFIEIQIMYLSLKRVQILHKFTTQGSYNITRGSKLQTMLVVVKVMDELTLN